LKIAGSHDLPFPPERAYDMMQDPVVLAGAIPGSEALEKIGENEYRMKMKMALASLSGAFEGKVRITDQTPPSSFRLIVEGAGKIGFMKGDGLLKLTAKDGGTEVAYDGDVQVGGTMAAVGQRLIDGAAKMLIKRFFEKLAEAAG
jgi:carbon monoxide dehydrogenase subunit G